MRLIDADEMKKQLENAYEYTELADVIEMLDNAPTIKDRSLEIAQKSVKLGRALGQLEGKLERPQGEWIDIYATHIAYECSNCHIQMPITDYFNFCPNCGAQMVKGGAT